MRGQRLFGAVREWEELADGFGFRLDLSVAPLEEAARWIELERHCCPFLYFALDVNYEEAWVRLTGSAGVKEFLRAQFGSIYLPFRM